MRLPRNIPTVVLIAVVLYVPMVFVRHSLPPMAWEATLGVTHAGFVRFLGLVSLALAALVGIALYRDIPWRDFGFARPRGRWLLLAAAAAVLGFTSTLALKWSGGSNLDAAMAGVSPAQILALAILAPCVEELFCRGWMQSVLQAAHHVRERRSFPPSAAVMTSALAFGAMHLTWALADIDALTVASVLVFTTLLGVIAGTVRQRTGSLGPAIGVHLAGNVGGIIGGIAYALIAGGMPK